MAIRAIAMLSILNTCVVLGFLGVATTLWLLAVVILTFGKEMKSYNKAVIGHFLLRSVLGWLRHFTPKLHYAKNAHYSGVRHRTYP